MKLVIPAVTSCLLLLVACSAAAESDPVPDLEPLLTQESVVEESMEEESAGDSTLMETAELAPDPHRAELPPRSPEAIAWVESRDGAVMGATGVAADGVPYVLHCACEGVGEMHYVLLLDGEEHSAGAWTCDTDVINTAFEGAGQEVEVQFADLPSGASGYAEVLPWSDELDPPGQ